MSTRLAVTPDATYAGDYSADAAQILSRDDFNRAYEVVQHLPHYEPTPLVEHKTLTNKCRVASVLIKDEGQRMPTQSFKLLGPPYALAKQLLARLDQSATSLIEIVQGSRRGEVQHMTACAATSGNHGRALAWAATRFGCGCRIYMPESTGAFREEQIARLGATTIRVPGTYDDAVALAVKDAAQRDYMLVGDGAAPQSNALRHIVHGYSILGQELIAAARESSIPTHVLVPAGSGSLAAAVTARLWMEYGTDRPKVIIVQPHSADSAYQSCLAGARVASLGSLATMMDGLSVRELSPDAWAILQRGAFAFMTIDDGAALTTLRDFAQNTSLAIGETGIAAIAAFNAMQTESDIREQLCLDESSRVILIATEGVTDPGVLSSLILSSH